MAEGQYRQVVVYTVEGNAALVTINRPESLNTLTPEVFDGLEEAVRRALADPQVIGIIITGAGDRAFCAGADVKQFLQMDAHHAYETSMRGHEVFRQIELADKPVIAAINGYALGGGCELALVCHLRVAVASARLGQPEVTLGLIPGWGGTVRLPRVVGTARALELLLTGRLLTAEEAYQWGLLNKVVNNRDELLPEAKALIDTIAEKGPTAVRTVLRCVRGYGVVPPMAELEREARQFAALFNTEEVREGVTAFLEKRKPHWR